MYIQDMERWGYNSVMKNKGEGSGGGKEKKKKRTSKWDTGLQKRYHRISSSMSKDLAMANLLHLGVQI